MSPSHHSSFSLSIILITSVLFHFFVKHVDGSVNYLIPATHSERFVLKPIEQADGSLAYEITSTSSLKPRQAKREKETANNIRPNPPSGASNYQKQAGAANPTKSTTTPLSASSPSSAQKAYEDPLLPSLLTDEPYTETDDFVWPVKLPSKYSKRPKPVTPSSKGLPLRLPSTLPFPIDNTTPTVTGSGSSSSDVQTAPATSGTGSIAQTASDATGTGITSPETDSSGSISSVSPAIESGTETLPTLPDLSADSSQSQTTTASLSATSTTDSLPQLPDLSQDSSQSPTSVPATSTSDSLPQLPDLS